jgi:hypothetical protein
MSIGWRHSDEARRRFRMKASTIFKVGVASWIGAAISFLLLISGFEFARWTAECCVVGGVGAVFVGLICQISGKLENDL